MICFLLMVVHIQSAASTRTAGIVRHTGRPVKSLSGGGGGGSIAASTSAETGVDVDLAKLLARHSSVAYTMNQRKLATWACRRCTGPYAGSFQMMQVANVPCKELMVGGSLWVTFTVYM